MNAVNRTLYIPLYGKAYVSRKGVILHDRCAEDIWAKEGFALRGKAKSKWLAYFMAMRAATVDAWVQERMDADTLVLHLGCGLDARCERVKGDTLWYDVDLPDVINVRKQYYAQTERRRMLGADLTSPGWLEGLPKAAKAVVAMEGVSMYLPSEAISRLFEELAARYEQVELIMDAYTQRAVRLSRWANPIRTVGAAAVTGIDDPRQLRGLTFVQTLPMTPEELIDELPPLEQRIFRRLYAGRMAGGLYRLHVYRSGRRIVTENGCGQESPVL